MRFPDEQSAGSGHGDAAGLRAEALDIVLDALEWQLAGARWQAVTAALTAMETALATGDPEALMAATADLELAGPVRVVTIGAPPVGSAAPQVRSQLNRLVHALGGISLAQQAPGNVGDDANDTSGG